MKSQALFPTDIESLKIEIEQFRSEGYKIAMTTGAFDVIHRGHVLYLEATKEKGYKLFAGVDSDSYVIENKGQKRPIFNETDRVYMVSSLKCVDIVFVAYDWSEIVKSIHPDLFVISVSSKNFPDMLLKRVLLETKTKIKKLDEMSPIHTSDILAHIVSLQTC